MKTVDVWRAWLRGFIARLPRDKSDTLLLLAGAVLVLLPHLLHLPLWIAAVSLATLGWRVAITVRGTRLPPAALLLPLAFGAVAGIWLTYQTVLGRDAGVAMLVLLVAFKMLEMRARRDLFVVIYLCFFLLLTTFFYAQGIGTALLMVAAIIVLFAAQLSFQFTGAVPPLRRRLWLSARVVLMAAPLAALLFVVFPRLQGPLWGMPDDATSGRTGMSSSMSPGNLAHLAQSDETAFRVRFIDAVPQPQLRYWRGIVLGDFDGRSWTRGDAAPVYPDQAAQRVWRSPAVRHEITLEPSNERWLFALDIAEGPPVLADNASTQSEQQELASVLPVEQRIRYAVVSHPLYKLNSAGPLADADRWLRLPAGSNPRARAAGQALQANPDPLARIQAVLQGFRKDQFVYTMEPPRLGRETVDEFLFLTKSGFCEHYSSAFVFLMRAAGVPARVVTGYQGGEINPVDGYMTVRQSDAHAWAEVWLAGRGWVRVDPTAAVAPERVRRGAPLPLKRDRHFGIPALDALMQMGGDASSPLAQLRFRLAALNNGWNQWILNYTPERQRGAVDALAARAADPRSWAVLLALCVTIAVLHNRRQRRRGDPVNRLYWSLCHQLSYQGLARPRAEGPIDFGKRIAASALPPARKEVAAQFLRLYVAYKYSAGNPPPDLLVTLKNLLAKLR